MNYAENAKWLVSLVNQWNQGEITVGEVPFEQVLTVIGQVYNEKWSNGDSVVAGYGNLMTRAMEQQDFTSIKDIFLLVANQLMVFHGDAVKQRNLMYSTYEMQVKIAYRDNWIKKDAYYRTHAQKTRVPFQGRGVVYSAITGGYDDVKEPQFVNPDLDYVLFTDNPNISSKVWQIRLIENEEKLDNVRLARRIKIMGHEYLPGYDYSIWVDGKLEIVGDLEQYVKKYRQTEPILCFCHYVNEDVYQEMRSCIEYKKDDIEIMQTQINRYRQDGYPEGMGMIESGLMVRELHDAGVIKLMETWWNEVKNGSKRDQLSFNYACWKNDMIYDTPELFIYRNEYVNVYEHI